MGYYLMLRKLDGTYHPAWDDGKYAGDREVMLIIEQNGGAIRHPDPYNPWRDPDPVYRPADFDALSRATWPDVNPERWRQLVAILRDEPDYWIAESI